MYKNICYKKPFLKEVIFKADFPSLIPNIEKGLSPRVTKVILSRFPLSEPQKTHAQEFQFSGPNFQARSSEIMQWIFHGESREKMIAVSQQAIAYTTKSYETYEKLRDDIDEVMSTFFSEYKDSTAGRVGLRYVNVIDVNDDDNDPLSWKDYINEEILGIIDFREEKEYLTRVFHILEYNFDGLSVKYQFGIANPDYPAPVKKKQFVLDIDSYSHGTFEVNEIKDFLGDAHSKIQDIFERSITDQTRNLMRQQNNVE